MVMSRVYYEDNPLEPIVISANKTLERRARKVFVNSQ